MASYATLARPYANAVFQVAQDSKKESSWSEALLILKALIMHDGVASLASDPSMSASDWKALCLDVVSSASAQAAKDLGDDLQRFLSLIIEAKRQLALPQIADLYQALLADLRGIRDVSLTSAFPLSDDKQAAYVEHLKKYFSSDVNVNFAVDPDLIGGAVIRSGDWVKDGSIRSKLNRLAQQLVGNNRERD